MKWNSRTTGKAQSSVEEKTVRGAARVLGGNVAYNGSWDPGRAMKSGMEQVTWVYRAVDAIASNAARIPIVIRENDPITGEIVEEFSLRNLLNSAPNAGEDSVAFRYRLSAQLLLSDNGAFIEVTKNRRGEVLALTLLPPHAVTPIPDQKKFIAGYDFRLTITNADGSQRTIEKKYKSNEVIWIRKPDPFNAYKCITALPAAGVAIESDWFAKMYNRNFLLNDGRPGGLVVVKGDMTEDDKEELRAKFGGSINRAGRISVIASDEGADFVDTAVSPRDAQYVDARQINKSEILMAFGVPESVLANAGGKTFDNAEMERHVFWMETMIPHLDLITRPMDKLDPNPNTYISYDLSHVDVLQRMQMKRNEFLLREYDAGTTSQNEYRDATGRPAISNDRADMLFIASSKFPAVTTTGKTPEDIDFVDESSSPEGRPEGGVEEEPEDDPIEREDERLETLPNTETTPAGQASAEQEIEFKGHENELWKSVAETTLEKLLTRASRVLEEKSTGTKFRRAFFDAEYTDEEVADEIVDQSVWSKQCYEDFKPVAKGILREAGLEEDPESVRVYNLPAKIRSAVAGVVARERSKEKPNMGMLPVHIREAVTAIGETPEVGESMSDFVDFYTAKALIS